MAQTKFALPDKVLRNLHHQGEAGRAWLDGLGDTIGRLSRDWDVTVAAGLESGTEAYVAAAVLTDGTPAALKIPIPGVEKADREYRVLAAASGSGYVRALRHDAATNAMLLERLGPQLAQSGLSADRQMEIICDTLRRAWSVPAQGLALMTGAQKAQGHADTIIAVRSRFPGICSDRVAQVALSYAQARRAAFDPATAVLGHGDAHAWNTLLDPAGDGYKFVDPDGLFIEKAFDLAISLRELAVGEDDDALALGRRRCRLLSERTGVSADAIWQWGVLERLVNGLLYIDVGAPEHAAQFLTVAEAWAAA